MSKADKKTIIDILGRYPIHPFPARMAPGIALDALGECEYPLRVLDPMSGSGTVLAVARSKGHRAVGIDMDPLAVLMAKTWTTAIDKEEVLDESHFVLQRAKRVFQQLTLASSYPEGSDEETKKFLRYWFDGRARRQLIALSTSVARVENNAVRDALWCAFSRLIITKQSGASLAMDISHSRPHKVFEKSPIEPFDKFESAVNLVATNSVQKKGDQIGPASSVKLGDARKLNLEDESIDFVLTSPPYLNAIDYIRCSKFSLVWMGYTVGDLRSLRSESIGAEKSSEEASDNLVVKKILDTLKLAPALSTRNYGMLAKYTADILSALGEVNRVLRARGKAVYVVGDSSVRGTFIRNSEIVARAAEVNGLTKRRHQSRTLPENRRYLPPPTSSKRKTSLDHRMRREVILTFEKIT